MRNGVISYSFMEFEVFHKIWKKCHEIQLIIRLGENKMSYSIYIYQYIDFGGGRSGVHAFPYIYRFSP